MTRPSRRGIVTGLAVAGVGAVGWRTDPLVALVKTWIADREAASALLIEWGRLEHWQSLACTATSPGQARRGDFSETREMRTIDRRHERLRRKLTRAAERIIATRAITVEGALAKIEMALKILEPMDCEEFSWGLIQGGFDDLRALG
ncbi:MAG: hypothetical protein Q7T19_13540 [Caulobacter sp.]|nr:hypothetical protein [Caulobacter sp.]